VFCAVMAPANSSGAESGGGVFMPRTNSISPVAGYMPEWWQGPDTCTAGDGIPNEWRRRVHADNVPWDTDLTGKGCSLLNDFWQSTDPWSRDTIV
jgi:hypothetical protein